ncbi:unnamed protein product [Heterobilharzia americana]|nr:unnamed protein product [Heterobilharzia americana]
MTTSAWVDKVKAAKATLLIQDERRKIHFQFPDGLEMVEEYDLSTHNLLSRKLKKKSILGGDGVWECEVGEPIITRNQFLEPIIESSQTPLFSRIDTPNAFQWRVRNLPYPLEVYKVTIEDESIVLQTTNKKYYKKFVIPDMIRQGLSLNEKSITLSHANNTLLISYKKPNEVLENEKSIKQYLRSLKPIEKEEDCKIS